MTFRAVRDTLKPHGNSIKRRLPGNAGENSACLGAPAKGRKGRNLMLNVQARIIAQ